MSKSSFSQNRISLNISEKDISLNGELIFRDVIPWPVKLFSPGIMGWYSFVPFMECNHGVLSLNHEINGKLIYNNNPINFNNGKGYIEKDWGSSFPSSYVWMQSNHFSNPEVSFIGSVAKIPWFGSWFRGFIAGLLIEKKLYRFTTYTNAVLKYLRIDEQNISFEIVDKKYTLTVQGKRNESGIIYGPYDSEMLPKVTESLNSVLHVKLIDNLSEDIIFEGTGKHAGLDVNGTLDEIMG